jgi:hypothetical protein
MHSKTILLKTLAAALLLTLGSAPPVRAATSVSGRIPIHWVLYPGAEPNCGQLNPGVTSVTGDGEEHFVSQTVKNKDGSITVKVNASASGTAVDNNGTTYSWAYVNHLSFTTETYKGHFTDRFDLVSHGKAPNYKVYLDWDVIIDPNHAPEELAFFSTFVQGASAGSAFCDPI